MSKAAVHTKPANTHKATRSNANVVERQNSLGAHVCIQREASALGVQPHAPALVRQVLNSPGQPLDQETRSLMEPRLGHDFSGVRVHTDEQAAASARSLNADAYTAGSHLAFGPAKYAPQTPGGQSLIAHELTHVVQQASGPVAGSPIGDGLHVSHPSDPFEQNARAGAAALATQMLPPNTESRTVPLPVPDRRATHVQRSDADSPIGTGASVFSALAGLGSLIVASEALKESKEQNRIARAGLGFSQRQAEAAEDQPISQPTQGGVASTHVDKIDEIKGPAAAVDEDQTVDVADVTSPEEKKKGLTKTQKTTAQADGTTIVETETKKGKNLVSSSKKTSKAAEKSGEKEDTFTVLRLQEGKDNRAEFKLNLRANDQDIKGGNTEDGDIVGYTGGSVASNASVAFKAGPGKSVDNRATVRLSFAGTNTPPRMTLGKDNTGPTKTANSPQRFSGSLAIDAKLNVVGDSVRLSANPLGTSTKKSGDGKSAPIVVVSLNASDAGPVAEPLHLNAPAPEKSTPPPPNKP